MGEEEFDIEELTRGLERATARIAARAASFSKPNKPMPAMVGFQTVPIPAAPEPDGSELDMLKKSLRFAVSLEFATIPPYLTALWSIIDQSHPIAKSIRAVAHEEMLHFSLLCNLLAALGEEPKLTTGMIPSYPMRLPGGVHPELELRLEGYGSSALTTFMELERPEKQIPIEDEPPETFPAEHMTIGKFYEKLLGLFELLNPPLSPDRQIAGPFTWFVMTEIGHVREAIGLIMAQGEGARGVPYTRNKNYLSHYYRFKSMVMGIRLVWDDDTKKLVKGELLSQPSVYTIAPVPKNGFGAASPKPVQEANRRFEETYSQMLRLLEASWQDSGDKSFVRAIECMFDLAGFARTMMQTTTPDGRGHCPTFRYLR
jgi:Ferritin-like